MHTVLLSEAVMVSGDWGTTVPTTYVAVHTLIVVCALIRLTHNGLLFLLTEYLIIVRGGLHHQMVQERRALMGEIL